MAKNYTPNTDGRCSVPLGTLVDVIHRDGEVFKRTEALSDYGNASECNWRLEDCDGDIMFWRFSKPAKENK